ncbi:MAG: PD-(D/E)XK nuclease family protein [Janthinobacterium lividum]
MNLYRVRPYEDFLLTLADFVTNKFTNKLSLKIILPTGRDCSILQEFLVRKLGNTFLPVIVPIADISTEGEETFKVPSEDIDNISYLEHKILLSSIIQKFSKLELNILQSLKFSSSLINLFNEFNYNHISIRDLNNLFITEHAEHWQLIYGFLSHAYYEIQDTLKKMNKSENSTYHIKMLEAEIERLTCDSESHIVIAGILGQNLVTWDFLKNIALSKRGFLVLPPIPEFNDIVLRDCTNEINEPLYCLGRLLKALDKNLSDFVVLPTRELPVPFNNFDKLLSNKNFPMEQNAPSNIKIEYFEFENIFQEAEKIGLLCREYQGKKIAIVINNERPKEFYINYLNKYGLHFQDEWGVSLLAIDICQLIMSISKVLYIKFCLTDLFILLKNPIINCDNVLILEDLLSSKNRFVSSFEEISNIILITGDEQLQGWWLQISVPLLPKVRPNKKSLSFDFLLKKSISVAEKICPHIWQLDYGLKTSQFFAEIVEYRINFFIDNAEDFPDILLNIVSGARLYDTHSDKYEILICKPENAIFSKYDLVILADFSEGSWPKAPFVNPWLNRKAQESLGCNTNQIKLSASLYNFYLLLHNSKVVITRSTKQASINTLRSSFVMKLLHSNPNMIINSSSKNSFIKNDICFPSLSTTNNITSLSFPSIISATDVEVLIRSPYSFYSKKILGLKKLENIAVEPKLSDFGNFIHKAIESYTKNYDKSWHDKSASLINFGAELLRDKSLPSYTQKIWQAKLATIAPEFVKFDDSRRLCNISIHSELRGKLKIKITDREIDITCVADRIEVNKQGIGTILDFKTGTIPASSEVLGGLSPQLIIEALTLIEGGFGISCTFDRLIYVKISSSRPYIKLTEINISRQELDKHKKGLQELLTYYLNNKSFQKNLDLLKYNDYRHLARLE